MGGIFDQRKPVLGGDLQERIHIRHRTAEVNRHDRARLRADGFANAFRIDIEGVALDIDKHGSRADA